MKKTTKKLQDLVKNRKIGNVVLESKNYNQYNKRRKGSASFEEYCSGSVYNN
jgi:hypothetical protein